MPGPWITPLDLTTTLEQGLKVGTGALESYWVGIIARCVERGYVDIKNYLMGKGYTLAQLDAWDDRTIYTRDQSLFYAYIEGGGPEDQSERDIKRLDRLTLLMKSEDAIALSIGGVMVRPDGTGSGAAINAGVLAVGNMGIDYGTTFGAKVNRRNGYNQYGDQLPLSDGSFGSVGDR